MTWLRKKISGEVEDPLKDPLYEYEEVHYGEGDVVTKRIVVKRRFNLRFIKSMVDRAIIVTAMIFFPALLGSIITLLSLLG